MYFIMNLAFAEPLLSRRPKAAMYDNGTLVLTGEMPENFEGTIVDLASEGFGEDGLSENQLKARVNILRAATPDGKLVIASHAQGQWLYANHAAFMPEVIDEIS